MIVAIQRTSAFIVVGVSSVLTAQLVSALLTGRLIGSRELHNTWMAAGLIGLLVVTGVWIGLRMFRRSRRRRAVRLGVWLAAGSTPLWLATLVFEGRLIPEWSAQTAFIW